MPTKVNPSLCDEEATPCDPLAYINKGKKLVVVGQDNCQKVLKAEGCCFPAIPIQLTENQVALADGSADHPIQLPCLQKATGRTVPTLIFQQADGTITKWEAPQECGSFKLSIRNGMFVIEEDTIPHIIPSDICRTNCDNIDFLLGVKMTTIACPGQTTKTVMQLMAVPKYACEDTSVVPEI